MVSTLYICKFVHSVLVCNTLNSMGITFLWVFSFKLCLYHTVWLAEDCHFAPNAPKVICGSPMTTICKLCIFGGTNARFGGQKWQICTFDQRLFAYKQPGVNLPHNELWVQSLRGTEIFFFQHSNNSCLLVTLNYSRGLLTYVCRLEWSSKESNWIHVRACINMACPSWSYEEALHASGLPTLESRRITSCHKLFTAMQDHEHKLHCMLLPKRESHYNQRHAKVYILSRTRTNRYMTVLFPTVYLTFDYVFHHTCTHCHVLVSQ